KFLNRLNRQFVIRQIPIPKDRYFTRRAYTISDAQMYQLKPTAESQEGMAICRPDNTPGSSSHFKCRFDSRIDMISHAPSSNAMTVKCSNPFSFLFNECS